MEPALIIGLTESITLAIIGIVGKWIVSRNEASNKKIAKRNSRIAQARDKEQLAFKKQIRAALDLTNDLTIAIQTGQTNGYITQSQEKFNKAIEDAKVAEQEARQELDKLYLEELCY